jgi:outer membrane receptor protein involved in Fe transport
VALACTGALASLVLSVCAAAASYAGRAVQEVLRELGASGLNFVYNTELVPPTLRVGAEPPAGTPLAVARALLAEHDLGLVPVGEDAWAIVRAEPAITAPAGAPAPAPLEEIVVTTSRYALAWAEPQPHEYLTHADVQALPRLADEPLRAVQRLPGSAATGISALTHMRGGEYDEVLMVLDGLPLAEPFHLRNFLAPVSLFDAAAIESMDVSAGGFTANFGDRMSGVIDIASLVPPEDRYTELGLSLFHASALSAGMFAGERGEWLGAVRRSNLDLISHAVDSDVGEPEYFDAFGRVGFRLGAATRLSAGLLTARDELEANTSDDTQKVDAEYRNTYVWGGWEQDWARRLSSRLLVALTDLDTERVGTIADPGRRSGSVDEERSLRSALARLDLSHSGERFYTRLGLEGREVRASYDYVSMSTYEPDYPFPGDPGGTVSRELSPEPEGHQYAAWLTSRARIGPSVSIEAGLRWDDQTWDDDDESGPEQLSPRLNVRVDLTPDTQLRAAWGRFWQAQGVEQLQVEDGVETFHPAQRADHLILSLEQRFAAGLQLRLELYDKDYDRLRPHFENLFDPLVLLPELEPDRVEVVPGHGRARGIEVSLAQRPAAPWSWWLSYAWSRVTDRIDGSDVPRSWDQRHSVNAGLRYAGERWELTLTDSWHSGWPTTTLRLDSDPEGPDQVTVGARNAARFGHYNSLDLRIMRRFALPDSTLEAFFEMTNALAQRNECCVEYDVGASAGEPVIDADVDYWPRLIPSLGVVWKF